jgi:hypothetical protein
MPVPQSKRRRFFALKASNDAPFGNPRRLAENLPGNKKVRLSRRRTCEKFSLFRVFLPASKREKARKLFNSELKIML